MVANRKVTGKASSMPGGLAIGGGVSVLVTVLLSLVAAKLADTGTLPEGNIGYASLVILLLSSGLGAWMSAAKIKRRRLVVCLAAGGVYYGILLGLTALFFGGQYSGMGVTALAVAGGSCAAGLMGIGQGRGRKRRVPRVHR